MSKQNKQFKRAMSLLLSAAMTASMLPMSVFAAEPVRIEDNSDKVQWSAGWNPYTEGDQNTHYGNEVGSTITVSFTGTGIEVYGKKAFNGPIMSASVDGGQAVDMDFFGDGGLGNAQLVGRIKDLAPGSHTLVLTYTDRHHPQSQASSLGKRQAEINYFVALNEETQTPDTETNFADGAINDTWTQDQQSVKGTGSVCAIEGGKLHLKAGSGNGNAHAYNNGPAVFVDKEASEALAKIPAEETKFFEYTVESLTDADKFRFGLFLDYKDPGNAAFVGTDPGGWFWETHPGTWYKGGRQNQMKKNEKATIRVEWKNRQITKATINGTPLFDTPVDISSVQNDKLGTVAFRLVTWGTPTEVLISNIKYSGQAMVQGYSVEGTVVDENGAPLAGATVEISGKRVNTNGEGKFAFINDNRFPSNEYTATITKEGYSTVTAQVVINGANVTMDQVTLRELAGVTGTVTGGENKPVPYASITLTDGLGFNKTVYADENGAFTMKGVPAGDYQIAAKGDFHYDGQMQSITVSESGAVSNLTLAPMATAVLSTPAMDVTVSTDFPTALKYDMKGDLAGKTMFGQTRPVKHIFVNGQVWAQVGEVTATPVGSNVMKYDIPVVAKDKGVDVDVTVHTELKAEGNVMTFTITGVDYNRGAGDRLVNPLEQIYFFDQSLASVRSSQTGAKLATATLAKNSTVSGDTFAEVNSGFNTGKFNGHAARYAFLSNNELSAGVFSNSDIGNGGAGDDNNRVITTAVDRGAYKNVGANSNQWYYDRKISSVDPANAADVADVLTAEQKVVGIREGRDQAPYVKVVITGEENNDGMINWQDAAIAARNQEVVHIPVHSDKVPEVVTTRIAMNFESEASNPFLTSLDNVKRVALHSDGLGQSVLLKGYASEGHDSGHPDYYDIGERMGGLKDFKTMLHEGHKYGAQFGIHTNASEFYPEADAFNDNAVRWDGTRHDQHPQVHYGWNWLDQGIAMNGVYDLAIDGRYNRFKMLHDLVGDNTTGGDGLDYIYVDVWGNFTSGSEQAWHTRKLSNDITAGGNNWRIVHEWAWANEWDSTFQHWVSDFGYGNFGDKGKLNSSIMRFMLNSHKDSWTPDFPSYGGACNAPLLGGPVMQGFEGWQSDYEYDLFIDNLYNQMIPTKFLQHYDVMNWNTSSEKVTLPYGEDAGSYSEGTTTEWAPDVQIKLESRNKENKPEQDKDKIVVTRGSDAEINEHYAYGSAAERLEYRSRHITLNGRTILVGASNPGDFRTDRTVKGDLRYLIPWYWDKDGNEVSADKEKLYHYNIKGGETTWELPKGWENLKNVTVYKLTDQGRTEKTTVAVQNGSVTLTAEAEIPYLVLKGDQGPAAPVVEWNAPDQFLNDVSFNGALEKSWTVTGNCEVAKTSNETPMLKITGEGSVSQKILNNETNVLKPGTKYAVYVGVDNRSDVKASMEILDSKGNVVASQYSLRSFVPNAVGAYVHQNKGDPSCFQNMYVFFTPVEGEEYTVVLSHEAGEGYVHFDDIRVVERGINNAGKNGDSEKNAVVPIKDHYTYDEQGNFLRYEQDFEHVAQGLYPFVVYNGGGVTDCRMHLAKKHAPYTQAGWATKKADDVLGGNWSVKINGQSQRNSLMYTTVPQNFHFEPGKFYTVEFDYQMGSEGIYEAVILDGGVRANNVTQRIALDKSLGTTAHASFMVTGAPSGQTAVGIWSTGVAPQVPDGEHADFGGYKDFMLDNLVIKVTEEEIVQVSIDKTDLKKGETSPVRVNTNVENGGVQRWENTHPEVAVIENGQLKAIGGGTTTLTAHLTNGEVQTFEITVAAQGTVTVSGSATANTEERGGEGPVNGYAAAATDGNPDSFWHSQWNGAGFNVSAQNPAILTVHYDEPQNVDGFMIQQRPTTGNGIVKAFKYRMLDAQGHVLAEGTVNVPADKQVGAKIMTVDAPAQGVTTLEISVTEGHNNFAALAEVAVFKSANYSDQATLNDATVGTDQSITMTPVTANGELVAGAQWTSSNPEIAVIDENGVVTGIKEGQTTITLSNAFGQLATAQVTVTVSETSRKNAAVVVEEINAIGEVTLDSELAIKTARAHYENLTEAAKALVTNLDVLEAAEAKLEALKNPTDQINIFRSTVALDNNLQMKFVVKLSDLAGREDVKAVITETNPDGSKTVTEKNFKQWEDGEESTQKYVVYSDLSAKEMCNQIEVVICDLEGNPLGNPYITSIQNYAEKILNGGFIGPVETMVVDMLNYGSAAQIYFNYNVDHLANAILTPEQKDMASKSVDVTDEHVGSTNYVTTSLSLEDNIVMNLYFQGITTDMHADVTYVDHTNRKVTYPINGTEFQESKIAGVMSIPVETLAMADGWTMVECVVKDGNGNEVASVTDSMASYAARALKKSTDTKLNTLLDMTMKFSNSAYNYFQPK